MFPWNTVKKGEVRVLKYILWKPTKCFISFSCTLGEIQLDAGHSKWKNKYSSVNLFFSPFSKCSSPLKSLVQNVLCVVVLFCFFSLHWIKRAYFCWFWCQSTLSLTVCHPCLKHKQVYKHLLELVFHQGMLKYWVVGILHFCPLLP